MLNRRNLKIVALGFLVCAGAVWLRGQCLFDHPSEAENSAAKAYSQALENADPIHGFVTDFERGEVAASLHELALLRDERSAKHASINSLSLVSLGTAALCGLVLFVTAPSKK